MELQGCLGSEAARPSAAGPRHAAGRPFVNSEYGANVYLPQAYLGGPNNPFLEKLQAWNYVQRWHEYMEAGTVGGTSYCLYDLEKPTDHGSSCFGIMTFDRQPKLACWEISHLWRDFEVAPVANGTSPQLEIRYRRDYHARNCRLALTVGSQKKVLPLEDFRPNEQRLIPKPLSGESFHWRMDFTTHGGLPLAAAGAFPRSVEESDFLASLKSRQTRDFLTTLFDAEVVTTSGQPAPPTTAEMARSDGVIPVALRKRDGTVYLALITREAPKASPYREALTVDVALTGKVEAINDMTGQPTAEPVEVESIPSGLRLKNVRAARIPGAYGTRFPRPFALPVYRIVPNPEK
jgi:hypothetical protein